MASHKKAMASHKKAMASHKKAMASKKNFKKLRTFILPLRIAEFIYGMDEGW